MMVMMVAGCRSCHEEDVHLFGCIAFLIETAALSEKINERSVAKLILLLHPCPSDADRNVQDTGHLRVIPSVSWSVLVVVVCASIVFPSCPIAMVNDERRRESERGGGGCYVSPYSTMHKCRRQVASAPGGVN